MKDWKHVKVNINMPTFNEESYLHRALPRIHQWWFFFFTRQGKEICWIIGEIPQYTTEEINRSHRLD